VKVTGQAGAGAVIAEMDGKHMLTKLKFKESALEEDPEILEVLVMGAVNDAVRKVEEESKKQIEKLTRGLNLPTDFTDKEDR
jgi:DNA-binding YbaB/EbfC family protein